MESIVVGERPHAVCIPSPFQGHINAMLKMAKILYSKGFRITFVHNESNYNRIVSSGSTESSLGSLDNFRFETVHGEVNYSSATITEDLRDPIRSLLSRLNDPPVTCIVTDSFMSFNLGFAAEMGVPSVSFCSVSACSFMGFLHYKELLERGIVPFRSESDLRSEYLDTVIEWIPGMTKNTRLRDLPSFIRTADPNLQPWFHFCKNESQAAFQATAIVMHTFDELEGAVLDALSSILPAPVYSIGPLNLPCSRITDDKINHIGNSLWKEDSSFMDWLEGRKAGSVVYVNFGSLTSMTSEQSLEVAWGIAGSGHDFLWVIRPNMVEGGASGILPSEFLSETKGRGLVSSWCVQEEVLRHPSIGGFFTHCGWNSMMDAISAGVPMMCWPQVGDQTTNCRYACTEWGIGMEIDADVRREEVEKVIRELMGGEKGARSA
uniref:Glycosyltransferase n=1 Tax=Crocus sativus TaxID=82528 RepID=A0A075M6K1_CROSA|nr:UDP-glucosyltransferase UGT85V1 [Crocus sativus]